MRVLLVVHGFPPTAQGGSEIYAHAHAVALARQFGDDVLVLTRDNDPNRPEYDVRAERLDGLRVLRVNNTFRWTRSFEETYENGAVDAIARRAIEEFRPHAAHVHHLTCLSTGIVRLLAERRIPCVLTLHDYWLMCHRGQLFDVDLQPCDGPARDSGQGCHGCLGAPAAAGGVGFAGARAMRTIERHLPSALTRPLRGVGLELARLGSSSSEAEQQARRRSEHMRGVCRDVTRFLAPSLYMRDRFVEFGVPSERITVANYGVDRTPFESIQRMESNTLRLGFLGSLMVSKGLHVLLEAFAGLSTGLASLDIYGAHTPYHGDDRYRHRLGPLLAQPGVRRHDAIPHDQVARALASIDVLVVPSLWPENSPLVIHEAFLAGVPVVASRIGGIPELVDDGRNGLLFRAGDTGDLGRALGRLLHEPGLLDRLRAGLPPVRFIDDDVRVARGLYEAHLSVGSAPSPSRVAAVVLNYRTPDDTRLAVRSLLASRRPIDEVLVIDNDACADPSSQWPDLGSQIRRWSTGANLGFSGGMNVGIRAALAGGADRVLVVNSDVIVPPDCVERLERCLERHGAGIAGPVVLSRSDPEWIASLGVSYSERTGRMRHLGVGRRLTDVRLSASTPVDAVSGCVMLIDRDVFDAVGLFDEDYFFSFEDVAFCLRARRAGFRTVLDGTATVYHEGGRSIGPRSPRRLYYATRNHLLMASRTGPDCGRAASSFRAGWIVALNVAHAVRVRGGTLPARLGAVARGVRDYVAGRFGAGAT